MKKYVPLKYIFGMLGLFLLIPCAAILILLKIVGIYDIAFAFIAFFGFLIVIGPIVFIKNTENASVIITETTLTNYMNDGTSNFGWSAEIDTIKAVKLAENRELTKIFKNCRTKKAILIDFGAGNIKYISVSLFSKRQIKNMLDNLESKKQNIH